MTENEHMRRAFLVIAGFACIQAAVYSVLYVSLIDPVFPMTTMQRLVESFSLLACMVIGLAFGFVMSRWRSAVFRLAPQVLALSLLPVIGAAAGEILGAGFAAIILRSLLCATPAAFLMCLWGRVLGRDPIEKSVPEVFIASALGGAMCFVLGALPVPHLHAAAALFVTASAGFFAAIARFDYSPGSRPSSIGRLETTALIAGEDDDVASEATALSGRIRLGTFSFGVAAGLIEIHDILQVEPYTGTASSFSVLLFVLYCLASLQLFGSRPLVQLSSVLPMRGDAHGVDEAGPLDGSYRLAVLLMVCGCLFTPVLSMFGFAGEIVAEAGFIAVTCVLVSLFVVMGHVGQGDVMRSMARGFIILFAGEACAIAVAGVFSEALGAADLLVVSACAGVFAFVSFTYLFTDRDLRALSVVIEKTDYFARACESIARQASLSKRESEILPLALKGRTSDRIANEFCISKNTVDTHIRRIYQKCGVHSRQELIDLGEKAEAQARRFG